MKKPNRKKQVKLQKIATKRARYEKARKVRVKKISMSGTPKAE